MTAPIALIDCTEEKVHLVGQEWQTAESWDEALHPLRGKIPLETYERRVPLRSEIHGWLLLSATQQRVHQVEFKDQR